MKKFLAILSLMFLSSLCFSVWNDTFFPGGIVTTDGEPAMVTMLDVPASSTAAFTNKSGGGIVIATATLVASGTSYVDGATGTSNQFTQITYPRNVVCDVEFTTGESTASVSGTLTVSGINSKGVSATDTITVTTNSAAGSVAFAFIDTMVLSGFTISNTATSNCTIHLGTGEKIGIPGDIRAAADVYKIVNAGVDLSTSTHAVSTTYNTIDLSAIGGSKPNGSIDYMLMYLKKKNH